ncbi:YheC/YheD family protein [Natranaerobius thermophilus]|uniref:ATP-grasp domain-containing protein n=1 Tax=Natranaerobius thermophilus (strain ATCC BAA-1301 / DSM 18059 / JW/NM-WN-LF) TaxID=457570 RepID=B2A820_NATTJ|nr:YheC/YheD family protein [Natranaerobius thermophilus]ACB85792.1 hypothetical protein Nther_2226 [Natranaerobius thermophilus JW/NM-WN-LF]
MLIGIYHGKKSPFDVQRYEILYTLTARAKMEGDEIIIFDNSGVDLENETICGHVRKDGIWIKEKTLFPEVIINVSPPSAKDRTEIEKSLRKKIPFTKNLIHDKLGFYVLMNKTGKYTKYLIPTKKVDSIKTIEEFINNYQTVIIKPSKGRQGKGVIYIEKKKDHYLLIKDQGKKHLHKKEFIKFANKLIAKKYLVQKYVYCRTEEGFPFDFRIVTQRDGKGNWVLATSYARIGKDRSLVTANISRGGMVANFKHTLIKELGLKKADKYEEYIQQLALNISKHVNKLYKHEIDELGVDIAVDNNENIWLFEVNTGPSNSTIQWETTPNKLAYAKYLAYLNRINKLKKVDKIISNIVKGLVQIEDDLENGNLEKAVNLTPSLLKGFSSIDRTIMSFTTEPNTNIYDSTNKIREGFSNLVYAYENSNLANAKETVDYQLVPNFQELSSKIQEILRENEHC